MKILCAAAAVLLALAASQASAKTLVYCSEGAPEGFDPAPYTATSTFDAARPVYERLVEFERGGTRVVPGLAESWTVSADGLEYTFRLRPGVKFHTTDFFAPTRELNADDVIFSFRRQLDTADPWYGYIPGVTWTFFKAMSMPELIKDIVKVDDRTVRFVLTRPEAPMLANLAMDFASILSKEYADKLAADNHKERLNRQPVGTGPFQFVAYQEEAVVRYRANPDYRGGRQPIDDLIFAITPDAAVRQQRLLAGECQITSFPNPADVPRLRATPGITVMEQPGFNIGYLAYNTRQPPFDRREVRKALNMAIDKRAILAAVYQGAGQIAINPIPPTLWSYNASIKDDPYDPEAAGKLLDEAGVHGLKMKIWAMPVQRPYNPNARRMAELIQADFAKVGVTAEIVSYDWAQYLQAAKALDRDGAVLLGWTGGNGDPDNFLAVLLGCDAVGGTNRAQWCDPAYDDLVQKAKVTADVAERTRLYEQAQAIFKREAPWATIAHSVVFMPMSDKVRNYRMDPLGAHRFDGVDIAE